MELSLLQIWLFVNLICHALSTKVTRRPNGDIVTPKKCIKSCDQFNAACTDKKKNCCYKCRCLNKKTYYYSKSVQTCVDPNAVDDCKYHFERSKDWVDLSQTKSKELVISHRSVKLFSYKCSLKKQQFWNLIKWEDIKGTKDVFKVEKDTTDYKIKLPNKSALSFKGQLVKILISCEKNGDDKEESCIIFKVIGDKNYTVDTGQKVITTTLPPVTTGATIKPARKPNYAIPVIIGVTVAILVGIGIFVICWCWKKRRKAKNGGDRQYLNYGEDPNYQPTDRFSMRQPNEIHNSANNIAYLQPVDAGVPYSSNRNTQNRPKDNNGRVKKDHNYEYPDINSLSQKSSVASSIRPRPKEAPGIEKPIYAEVGDIKPTTPEYSDPDHLISKKRADSELVGVPGYQPPRGPYHDDVSTYSSLGVVSDDSSVYQALLDPDDPTGAKAKPKPRGPEYAIVEAELSGPIEHDYDEDEIGDIII